MTKFKSIRWFILISVLFTYACTTNKSNTNVNRAFYYWKSSDSYFDSNIDSIIDSLNINKLYIKYFEVEYNNLMGIVPISKTNLSTYYDFNINYKIIPTVYIQNEVFKHTTKGNLDTLADNIVFLINKFNKEKFSGFPFSEYQIDCDWTISTKDNYFYLLEKIKELSKMQISTTLRLYPFKFKKEMGVPPVDRVMLMCYNLLSPLDDKQKNSILDLDELRKYTNGSEKYPLPLDVALPIYSWAYIYQNNKLVDVIYTTINEIGKDNLKEVKPMWYQLQQDVELENIFLRKGDMIKYEEIDSKDLNAAINIIKNYIKNKDINTVALFHLDPNQLMKYNYEEINRIYNSFNK